MDRLGSGNPGQPSGAGSATAALSGGGGRATTESGLALHGTGIAATALHCQKKTARVIVERGGEYILAVRDNQPKLARRAEGLLAKAPPLCPLGTNAAGARSSPAS